MHRLGQYHGTSTQAQSLEPVLEYLRGQSWDEGLEAYVHGVNPCGVVVSGGHQFKDFVGGRVIVVIDQFWIVQGIYQQVAKTPSKKPACSSIRLPWYTAHPEWN